MVKKNNFILLALVFVLINCTTEPQPEYTEYIIRVDEVAYPKSSMVGDSVIFIFEGVVGTDGCYRYKTIEVGLLQNEIQFTLLGEYPNFTSACPDVMVYLNGLEYKTIFDSAGLYKILIKQPDNLMLVDSIVIK